MSSALNYVPIPVQNPIAQPKRHERFRPNEKDPQEGMATQPWTEWFTSLSLAQSQTPSRVQAVTLSGQAASIGATDLSGGALSAGLYRVTYYARITQAATTSSSLTVTIDWTDGGTTPSFSGAAMTGNTVTTFQSETLLINVDPNTPIRYSTVYASSGATPMLYALSVILERVAA